MPYRRSKEDKLAFAIHAYILSLNYKLIAVGPAAENESADWTSPLEEIDHQGWNDNTSAEGFYTFRYQDLDNKRPPLYVKLVTAAPGTFLLHWAPNKHNDTVKIDVAKFTTDDPNPASSYKNLPLLIGILQQRSLGLLPTEPFQQPSGPGSSSSSRGATTVPSQPQPSRPDYDPSGDPLRIAPPPRRPLPGYGSPGMPLGVGTEDVVPPGVRPPGYYHPPLPPSHQPGNLPSGPHRGGGMHVGPGDPIFGAGRYGRGVGVGGREGGGGGEVLPPGARWDPIAPEGLPGAHPEDYVPDTGPRIHPDVMQPGPGNGGSFDSMFG
jgi:proteasome inhibitor subunit 1 (PI31)